MLQWDREQRCLYWTPDSLWRRLILWITRG